MCHHACMAPCPQPYSQPRESGRPRHLRHHWAKVQTECPSPLRAIRSLQRGRIVGMAEAGARRVDIAQQVLNTDGQPGEPAGCGCHTCACACRSCVRGHEQFGRWPAQRAFAVRRNPVCSASWRLKWVCLGSPSPSVGSVYHSCGVCLRKACGWHCAGWAWHGDSGGAKQQCSRSTGRRVWRTAAGYCGSRSLN